MMSSTGDRSTRYACVGVGCIQVRADDTIVLDNGRKVNDNGLLTSQFKPRRPEIFQLCRGRTTGTRPESSARKGA